MVNVAVVGAIDEQIEELLKSAGMRPSALDLAGLANLAQPTAAQPTVIVLDLRDGKSIPPAVAGLRQRHPTTGVVIVVQALEPALLLDAVRAGVNEVVAAPLTRDSLEVAVSRVAGQQRVAETGQVFGFIGAKGGVGTTTAAVNVAASLAAVAKDGRVLLIDLHQGGGDAAVFLDGGPKNADNDRHAPARPARRHLTHDSRNTGVLDADGV